MMAANAEAGYFYNWQDAVVKPYIGAEYVYSKAHQGGSAKNFKDNFNSGKADLGLQWDKNIYTEFSYQMSGELKNREGYETNTVKNSFQAYAFDLYGKMPIMCSNWGALLTVGGAIYELKYKGMPDKSTTRFGYRGGIGLQYDMTQNWSARVVGRYSYLGSSRINNFKEVTVGMLYSF